jgi:hypothetical protein
MIPKLFSWLFGTCSHSFSKWETRNHFISQEWGRVREVQDRKLETISLVRNGAGFVKYKIERVPSVAKLF